VGLNYDLDSYSVAYGFILVLIPVIILFISDRASQADVIAYGVCKSAQQIIENLESENYKKTKDHKIETSSLLPYDDDDLNIIYIDNSSSMAEEYGVYSKVYDCYFLVIENWNISVVEGNPFDWAYYYCDSNYKKLSMLLPSSERFNLKRYLIKDNFFS